MAHIKCKWALPYCRANRRGGNYDFGYPCFNPFGDGYDGCENFCESGVAGSSCAHIEYDYFLIDKEVNGYELSSNQLKFGRKTIDVADMLYLFIDGYEYKFKFDVDTEPWRPHQVIDWNAERTE